MSRSQRHQHILNTAKTLFEKFGYDHVTIADVIKASNVARGTFYLHFNSLESLLSQLFEEVVDRTWGEISPILEEVEDVEACAVATVRAVLRMFGQENSLLNVFFSGGGAAFLKHKEDALYGKLGGLLAEALDRRHRKLYGTPADGIRVPNVAWTVAMLISMVADMAHYSAVYVPAGDREAFEDSLIRFVVAGCKEHLAPLLQQQPVIVAPSDV